MAKHLVNTSYTNTHIILEDEVYSNGNKEKGFTYHRRLKPVNIYIEEYEDGYLSGNVHKVTFTADDILMLADKIKEVKSIPASRDELPTDDLPF